MTGCLKAGTFRAQITDHDHKVCYASADRPCFLRRLCVRQTGGPFSLDKHTLLKSPIKGGHVYWQEDITEITALLEKLEENREAIAESNHLEQGKLSYQAGDPHLREKTGSMIFSERNRPSGSVYWNDLFSRYNERRTS